VTPPNEKALLQPEILQFHQLPGGWSLTILQVKPDVEFLGWQDYNSWS
jgi:hypothetical protein